MIVVSYHAYNCYGHRIQIDDLDVAASNKQNQWDKGDEADHHQSDFSENTEKHKKGHDSKRGCIFSINLANTLFVLFAYHIVCIRRSNTEKM